ncbi:MAG: hypothetical protein A3G76_05420 [Acidobacteria bacterium RIFCSPLOWO2_12_FULL_65_11]|nr:MAG: hypothetical protein A3H95_17620 [Acidobacteria bacterium RIFCSPLOWO2_02_FULL_64_15]OFW33304.1 MAG: hypothetical protein A3G76_05420 [Acidobacteria bacterium RIFCSPLOWO2_12_FULL_65_11]
MKTNRRRVLAYLVALVGLAGVAPVAPQTRAAADTLPRRLTDRTFWQLIVDASEPGGSFRSDNFISNESTFQEVIPRLRQRGPGGVYLGVGPDQNFTYITALRPKIAFIVDIRRQNMLQHLMYKALIEASEDRADFLSRLFSRPRPAGLDRSSTPQALFEAFAAVPADQALFDKNLQEIGTRLVKRHGFALAPEDLNAIEYVYRAFFASGPDLRYSFPRLIPGRWFPTYAELMMQKDLTGQNHSYVATEENYRTLREFQQNNLLVPIVGDFAGEKALRAVGRYVRDHGATVTFFYTSNVEQYLFQGDAWLSFFSNVSTLPARPESTFIRSYFDRGFVYPPGIVTPDLHSVQLLDPITDAVGAFRAGDIRTYLDIVSRSK